jgi:hypothetical protein
MRLWMPHLILLRIWCKDAIKAEAVPLPTVIDWPAARGHDCSVQSPSDEPQGLRIYQFGPRTHPAARSRGTRNSTLPSKGSSTMRDVGFVTGFTRQNVLILEVLLVVLAACSTGS